MFFVRERENYIHKRTIQMHIIILNCSQTAVILLSNVPHQQSHYTSKINYIHIHRLQIVCYLDISLLYKHDVLHINNMQRVAEKHTDSSVAVGCLVSSLTLHYLLSITWICSYAWCALLLSTGIRCLAGIASGHAGMIWVAQ